MTNLERLSFELVSRLALDPSFQQGISAELETCLLEIKTNRANCANQIEEARLRYASDDIEIDDEPVVCASGDSGVWVQAWVHIASCEEPK